MDERGFITGSLWMTTGRLWAVVARFLAGLAVARVLGPEGRGQYAILILVPNLLIQILNLGLGQANAFMLGRRQAAVNKIAANALLLGGIGGTAGTLGLLAFWQAGQWRWLPSVPLCLLALSCAAVPFALIHFFASYALLGLGQVHRFGILLFVEGLAQLIYLGLFLFLLQWGLTGATLAWTLTALTYTLLSVVWLAGSQLPSLRLDLPLLKDTLSYGLRIYPVGIMQFLNLRFDQFLVEYLAGSRSLGLYVVAVSITETAWQVPIALSTALFSYVSTTSDRQANLVTPRMLRVTVGLAALETVGLLVLGRLLIRLLFGIAFEPALPALYGLLPGTLAYAIARVLEGSLAGQGRPLVCSLAVGVAVMATVALDLLWIPRWGIVGAAWASSTAYAVNALLLLAVYLRITRAGGGMWRLSGEPR